MSTNLSRSQANVVRLVWMLVAAVLAVMAIFPLLYMLSIAFKGPTEVFKSNLIPAKPVFDNFVYVLTEVPFWRYLINTFVISAVVTVVALFFHTMAGYALARLRFPGREVVFLAMFSTFLVSLPVIIVPLFILVRSMGMLNSYAGLIVPAVFNAFGIFLLRQYYLSLPKELEEAAVIDGAGYWRIYRSAGRSSPRWRSCSSLPTGTRSCGRSPSPRTRTCGSCRWPSPTSRASTPPAGTTPWPPRPSSRCRCWCCS